MEREKQRLCELFDLQRFVCNARLDAMLREAEEACGSALAEEDLELVSAAGEARTHAERRKPEEAQ